MSSSICTISFTEHGSVEHDRWDVGATVVTLYRRYTGAKQARIAVHGSAGKSAS